MRQTCFAVAVAAWAACPSSAFVPASTAPAQAQAASKCRAASAARMVADDLSDPRVLETPKYRERPSVYRGACFVVKDNIDTDQIIPAEYLTLVPSKVDEYEKLGSYALIGLPDEMYKTRYVPEGSMKTPYPIIIAGDNFGCGSSREHAPIALGAAGNRVVVAESYARIFFRNSIATGELYPYESAERLCDSFATGDDVSVDLDRDLLINHSTGKEYPLKPLGDAGPVIKAGGLFPFAIKSGMINKDAIMTGAAASTKVVKHLMKEASIGAAIGLTGAYLWKWTVEDRRAKQIKDYYANAAKSS